MEKSNERSTPIRDDKSRLMRAQKGRLGGGLSPTFVLLLAVAILAGLYFGRDILLPLAIALLLCFILAPLVRVLERWGIKRVISVGIVVTILIAVVGGSAWMLAYQVIDLNDKLPRYKQNLIAHIEDLPIGGQGFNKGAEAIQEIYDEVTKKEDEKKPQAPSWIARLAGVETPEEKLPQPVEVVKLPGSELEQIRMMFGPLVAPLSMVGIVLICVIFILIAREDLRDRFIYLIGRRNLLATTRALDDAVKRLSRFLLMQLLLNVGYGIIVGVVLAFVGVPNAFLWGVLTIGLKFLPLVGPWIAAGMPTLLSLATSDNWTGPLIVIGTFVVLELLSNNIFEPLMFGTSMGVSEVGIIVSVIFWTFMWGAVGLLVAMPLTVCLVVLGKHIPQLRFLHVLLSNDAGMPLEAVFYQRLLANDRHEAGVILERYLRDHTRAEFIDDVLLPVLHMAEIDRHAGEMDDEQSKVILDLLLEVASIRPELKDVDARPLIKNANPDSVRVLVVPARDVADEIAACILEEFLQRKDYEVAVASVELLAGEMISQVEIHKPDVIFISAMPPVADRHSTYLCKRFTEHFPRLPVVVGLWLGHEKISSNLEQQLTEAGCAEVVRDFSESIAAVHHLGQPARFRRNAEAQNEAEPGNADSHAASA